jgi:hypothetical protein|tara:strand:+ start:4593 stop:4994 length:402 start_codon:yes stop_codon:yes gene_type:complete
MDTGLAHRKDMAALESAIMAVGATVETELNHYFADGTYTRELFVPAGTVLTGRIHKYSAINILSHGKAIVITDKGRLQIQSPYTFVSGAGVKKAIYAVEDIVLINVMPWDGEPDPDLMEDAFTVSSYDELGEK